MRTTVIDCTNCGQKLSIPTDRGTKLLVTCPPCRTQFEWQAGSAAPEAATAEPPLGAHLVSPREGYLRHGIYAGKRRVVVCSGGAESASGMVDVVSMEDFVEGHGCAVEEHEFPQYTGAEVVDRARSRIGMRFRSMAPAGEMFCEWCINDLKVGPAVEAASVAAPVGGAAALAALGLAAARTDDAIALGAHLVTPRTGYQHHGIYAGSGLVIHYSGWAEDMTAGKVEVTTLDAFCAGSRYTVKTHRQPRYRGHDVVDRARSRLGEDKYCVMVNNCEHFCEWAINDDHRSGQVDLATGGAGATAASMAGLAARGVVAASGAVAGVSGAGIMSGLATAGSVVGGGAVAGVAVLGGVPGLAGASLVNSTLLADNDALPTDERDSRSVGRAASYVGAVAGTAGSIGAISAAGTVAGLSGAGITSGLAAIGSVVGGGMAGGVVVATAAPVAAAVGIGYGTYKLVKWIKDW